MIESKGEYYSVGWGITLRCNLSCPHCYSSAVKSASDELSTVECRRLIDSMAQLGVKNIGWTGGEPLLRRDLEELIIYAHEHGIISGITTNGILLNKERVGSLRAAGINSLQISLDGSTPERNRYIRGARATDFQLIVDGLKMSLEARLPVSLAMIVGRETMDDVLDYVELARSVGVKLVRLCGFVPHGAAKGDAVQERMSFTSRRGELVELVEKLQEVDSPEIALDPAFGPLPPAFDFHRCQAGILTFYVSSNGDIYPCTALIDDRFKVGNVRQRCLLDIVRDPGMTEIASMDRADIHGHCRSCQYFRVCHGACRGTVYAHTSDLHGSFPVCLYRASAGLD